ITEVKSTSRGRTATTLREYLARWKGYGPEVGEWYTKDQLQGAPDLLRECNELMDRIGPPVTAHTAVPETAGTLQGPRTHHSTEAALSCYFMAHMPTQVETCSIPGPVRTPLSPST
ncbi:hypothetical protein KEM55_003229, partial [Ascosphaera atra]